MRSAIQGVSAVTIEAIHSRWVANSLPFRAVLGDIRRPMKRILALSFLLFAAACGDDGPATSPDAEVVDMPDAEVSPDADNSCTTDTACVGHSANDVLCNSNNTAVITCNQVGDCLDAVSTACTGGDSCVDDGTPACDPPACVTDTPCLGQTNGATLCVGNAVVTCAANGACLSATSTACTNTDVCVADGTPACEANGDGEACASARVVVADETISGADFGADYTSEQTYSDASCVAGGAANPEAVFAVNLNAHQTMTVTEGGALDVVIGIQDTCGDASVCAASTSAETLTYTTDVAKTVYVYVAAAGAANAAYSIAFAFTQCGDGAVSANEDCDDGGNTDDDGCSPSCGFEFGFLCDNAEPTVCAAMPDLGTVGVGATISDTYTDTVVADDVAFYTITFTDHVLMTGTLTATTTGDPDLYPIAPSNVIYADAMDGDETIGAVIPNYFPPGKYVLLVNAYADAGDLPGFSLSLTTAAGPTFTNLGTFAAGEAITPTVDTTGLAPGASDFYSITFSTPVLLSGSLSATTTGDMDFVTLVPGDAPLRGAEIGDESWLNVELPAGTYYWNVNAYFGDAAATGYTLSFSTTAP